MIRRTLVDEIWMALRRGDSLGVMGCVDPDGLEDLYLWECGVLRAWVP